MKYKVKFRVTREDGKKQKYAINMEDGSSFAVGNETLGIELRRSNESKTFCTLNLRDASLFITDAGNPGGVKFNNKPGSEFEIKPGDCLQVDEYSIEFLEVPYTPKTAAATQFLDISDMIPSVGKEAKAAQQGQPASTLSRLDSQKKTKEKQEKERAATTTAAARKAEALEKEKLAKESAEAREAKAGATMFIERKKDDPFEALKALADGHHEGLPQESASKDTGATLKLSAAELEAVPASTAGGSGLPLEDRPEATLMSVMRPNASAGSKAAEKTGKVAIAARSAGKADGGDSEEEHAEAKGAQAARAQKSSSARKGADYEMLKHVGTSATILAIGAGCVGMIVARNTGLASQTGFTYGAGGGLVGCAAVSYVFRMTNDFFGMRAPFQQYLRFFSYFSVAAILWGFSFAFPSSVVIFLTVLVGMAFMAAFAVRFAPNMQRFFAAMGAVTAVAIAGSWAMLHNGNGVVEPQKAEVASNNVIKIDGREPAAVETAAPGVGAQDVTPAQPQPVAPVAPQAGVQQPQPVARALPAVTAPPMAAETAPGADSGLSANKKGADQFAIEQFFSAVKENNFAVVRTMIEKGTVDPDFTLDHGTTALMHASAQGYINMVRYLVQKRVNINAQDPNGTTALMWAAYRGHKDVVSYLVSRGADMSIKREDGDRAIDIASRWKQYDIVKLLKVLQQRAIASAPSKYRKN